MPLSAVREVAVAPDAVAATRGQPAVRVRLEGQRWHELLIGCIDAAEVAAAIDAAR